MTRSFVTRHHSSLLFSFILLLPFLFHSSSPCDLLFLQINLSSVQRVASISLRATVFTLTTGRKRDECLWRGGCKDFPRDLLTLSERWSRSRVKRTLGEDSFEFDPKTRSIGKNWVDGEGGKTAPSCVEARNLVKPERKYHTAILFLRSSRIPPRAN